MLIKGLPVSSRSITGEQDVGGGERRAAGGIIVGGSFLRSSDVMRSLKETLFAAGLGDTTGDGEWLV